jgi:hypothetical protein
MRTGTLTRPNEIVPLQIGRGMNEAYPLGAGSKTPAGLRRRRPVNTLPSPFLHVFKSFST